MERLAEVDTVVFDKTGTLSHGEPAVNDIVGYIDQMTPRHLVGLAAAAETKLKHPVAEALRAKARESIEKGDKTAAEQVYRQTVSALDKAIQKGTLHENTASRYKSRLGKRVGAMK